MQLKVDQTTCNAGPPTPSQILFFYRDIQNKRPKPWRRSRTDNLHFQVKMNFCYLFFVCLFICCFFISGLNYFCKRKQRLYNKFLKNRNEDNETEYKNNKLFETITKRSKKNHFSKLILTFKNNIKKTWELLKIFNWQR